MSLGGATAGVPLPTAAPQHAHKGRISAGRSNHRTRARIPLVGLGKGRTRTQDAFDCSTLLWQQGEQHSTRSTSYVLLARPVRGSCWPAFVKEPDPAKPLATTPKVHEVPRLCGQDAFCSSLQPTCFHENPLDSQFPSMRLSPFRLIPPRSSGHRCQWP
jgi:hypothetical protein